MKFVVTNIWSSLFSASLMLALFVNPGYNVVVALLLCIAFLCTLLVLLLRRAAKQGITIPFLERVFSEFL